MEQPREGDQQLPTPNERQDVQTLVWRELSGFGLPAVDLVRKDITARRDVGIERYGTPLQPFNGRDALRDLYEELLDAMCYARQAVLEVREQHDGRMYQIMHQTYTDLAAKACTVRMLMEERDAGPPRSRQRAPAASIRRTPPGTARSRPAR